MSFDILPVQTTFPDTFLDLRTEIEVNGVWTDISDYVQRDPMVITRGHQDESTDTQASQATFTLNNNDGRFSSHNPAGPYYPYIGRNSPVRVSVPEGASYLRLENDNLSYVQSTTTPAITGSIDIQVDATLDNWNTYAILASKWNGPDGTGADQSWMIALNGSYIFFYWAINSSGLQLRKRASAFYCFVWTQLPARGGQLHHGCCHLLFSARRKSQHCDVDGVQQRRPAPLAQYKTMAASPSCSVTTRTRFTPPVLPAWPTCRRRRITTGTWAGNW